jgi:hypothetical protein
MTTAPGPRLIPGTTIVVPHTQEQGAVVTRQEFELLLEGAPANRHASRRDVCAGAATTALVGAVGILATAEYFRDGAPLMWSFVFTVILVAAFLATTAIAILAHRDSTRQGGSAYAYCVQRIEQRFGPAAADAAGS